MPNSPFVKLLKLALNSLFLETCDDSEGQSVGLSTAGPRRPEHLERLAREIE